MSDGTDGAIIRLGRDELSAVQAALTIGGEMLGIDAVESYKAGMVTKAISQEDKRRIVQRLQILIYKQLETML